MSTEHSFWNSSIGLKVVMALTGVLLILFVVGHLVGNLQMFVGPDAVNEYAAFLKSLGPMLWVVRVGLIVVFVIHIFTAIRLTRMNFAARPEAYQHQSSVQLTLSSRTMMLSGLTILAFVVFHLMHFTLQVTHPEFQQLHDAQGRHDVYRMVVLGFQNGPVAFAYFVAMVMLALHLSHAIASIFQTLGLINPKNCWALDSIRLGVAGLIFVGYVSIPLAVQVGVISV